MLNCSPSRRARFDSTTVTRRPRPSWPSRAAASPAWLTAQGVERGDRLALRMPNDADHLRLLVACAAGGFVAVSVNTRYSDAEVDRPGRAVGSPGRARLDDGPDGGAAPTPIDPVGRGDDPFVVFTTSGTTSQPKMVLHRQRSIVDHARDAAIGFDLSPDDVVLAVMPLGGTFGLTSLTAAARRIVPDRGHQLRLGSDGQPDRRATGHLCQRQRRHVPPAARAWRRPVVDPARRLRALQHQPRRHRRTGGGVPAPR